MRSKYFFLQQARYFWFAVLLLFFVEPNQIFSRITNLTFQARTTALKNKYSYPNATKRSINTLSHSLTILIDGSRLRQHSEVKKRKQFFEAAFFSKSRCRFSQEVAIVSVFRRKVWRDFGRLGEYV